MNLAIAAAAGIAIIIVMNFIKNRGVLQSSAAQFKEKMQGQDVVVLDVRTPQEYGQGHIDKARLVPVAEIATRISELNDFKNKPVLVYCHAGSRSSTACRILKQNGFANVVNLQGGIQSWKSAGYPIT